MYVEGSFQSKSLKSSMIYAAVLPEVVDEQTKTVFLLHGFGFDQRSCLNTPLVQCAKNYDTVFFCPFVSNIVFILITGMGKTMVKRWEKSSIRL